MACAPSSNTTNQYTCGESNSLCEFAKYKTIDGMCISQTDETVLPFTVLPAGGYANNKIRISPGDFDWSEYTTDPFPCRSFLVWGDPLCCGGDFEIALFDGYQLIKNIKGEVVSIELNIVRRDISWVPASKIFDNWFPGKTHRRGEKLMVGTPVASFKIEMIEDALCKLLGDLNYIYPDISSAPAPTCSGKTIKVRLGDSWQFYTDMSVNNVCAWIPSQNTAGLATVTNFGSVKMSCPPPDPNNPTVLSTGCLNLVDYQASTTKCLDDKRIVNFPIAYIGGANLKYQYEQINTTFTTGINTVSNLTWTSSYVLTTRANLFIDLKVTRSLSEASGNITLVILDSTSNIVFSESNFAGTSTDFTMGTTLSFTTPVLPADTYTIEIRDENIVVAVGKSYGTNLQNITIKQNNSTNC